MRTKYNVHRHYRIIFTGTLPQVKKFLISIPEFANYKKKIRQAKIVDGCHASDWNKTIDFVCCMTEYCSIKPIDRRKVEVPFNPDQHLDMLVDKQRENFKKIGIL